VVAVGGTGRRQQRIHARGVRRDQGTEHRLVQRPRACDGVRDGTFRHQLQHDRHVPERQVEIHHADPVPAALGQRDGQVDRHRGLAAAALRGEHRHHAAVRRRAGGRCAGQLPGDRQRLRTGGTDRRDVAGVDHVAYPRAHRLAEHRQVHRGTQQHHAQRGPHDPLLGGEPGRVRDLGTGAEQHQQFVRTLRQRVRQVLRGPDGVQVAAEQHPELLGVPAVRFVQDGHRVLPG
jgi:hypothetical protein